MTTSLLTKLSIAAAATMLTFSAPALAGSKHHHNHGYHHSHGKSGYHSYQKRKHARQHHRRGYHAHRHWKPRFYWNYAYRPYRTW
jgi:hypothetical protein